VNLIKVLLEFIALEAGLNPSHLFGVVNAIRLPRLLPVAQLQTSWASSLQYPWL
jgi:hypothetical protein